MLRSLASAVFALVLAFGGVVAAGSPARADAQDTAAAALGLLALFAIANELGDDKNDKKIKSNKTGQWLYHRNQVEKGRYGHAHVYGYPKAGQKRSYSKKRLPRECVRRAQFKNGKRSFVTRNCLNQEHYRQALPRNCAFLYHGKRANKTAYSLNCLRNKGYRVEGRG